MNWLSIKDFIEWIAQLGILGFLFWFLQFKITKRQDEKEAKDAEARKKRQDEVEAREEAREEAARKRHEEIERKEAEREKYEQYRARCSNASLDLSIAIGKAIQRIPDAHCNGDMHAALDEAIKVRDEKDEFLEEGLIKEISEVRKTDD